MTYSEEQYNALLAVCRSYKNDYDSAFERLKAQQREIDGLRAENARLTEKLKQVLLAVDTVKEMNAMCNIDEQNAEIERLKAELKQLKTNAEILARGVRDLNHENYELTEKIKQAKIDVLNELKKKIHDTRLNDDTAEIIIEMIEELTKCQK